MPRSVSGTELPDAEMKVVMPTPKPTRSVPKCGYTTVSAGAADGGGALKGPPPGPEKGVAEVRAPRPPPRA